MDGAALAAFSDELEKLAVYDRHAYYDQNRAAILRRNRMYRQQHQGQIRVRQKLYRRKVKSGAHRQQKRVHQGRSYVSLGYR